MGNSSNLRFSMLEHQKCKEHPPGGAKIELQIYWLAALFQVSFCVS